MKATIAQLKQDTADAKIRQAAASKDVKRIERDMHDFDNNKDNKLAELEACVDRKITSLYTNTS